MVSHLSSMIRLKGNTWSIIIVKSQSRVSSKKNNMTFVLLILNFYVIIELGERNKYIKGEELEKHYLIYDDEIEEIVMI